MFKCIIHVQEVTCPEVFTCVDYLPISTSDIIPRLIQTRCIYAFTILYYYYIINNNNRANHWASSK